MSELTKFKNLSVDTSLGGNNASDDVSPSQKAIKHYIDVRNDIPLGFGIWTDLSMNSETWGTYTGSSNSTYTAALYPVMWALLNDIVTGTIESESVLAMTSTDLSNIPNLASLSGNYTPGITSYVNLINKGINPVLALSWFFIVDTTNNVFYVPQNVREENSVGSHNIIVETGTTSNNGTYSITCCGDYVETSHFARLVKATNKDGNETYKITQSLGEQTEYACDTWAFHTGLGGFDFHVGWQNAKATKSPIMKSIHKTLADTDYDADIYIAKSSVTKNTVVTETDIAYLYPNEHGDERCYPIRTTTNFSLRLRCWADEGFANPMENTDIKCIANNETEKFLLHHIVGRTAALPALANFTTSKRLYIKINS